LTKFLPEQRSDPGELKPDIKQPRFSTAPLPEFNYVDDIDPDEYDRYCLLWFKRKRGDNKKGI
jgi:hypothetical protein